ncbi:hypothetical protein C8R47DRAFT_1327335 [Mycena vitilis]|nr:hypothetical protein C8R47DRAFT_1327335 [Mycena vitilis]
MAASLSALYRIVSTLCLIQIVSGIVTMRSFGWNETGESQLMLIFYALFVIVSLHQLSASTRHNGHRLSRVDKHIQSLTTLLMGGVLILLTATIFLFTRGSETVFPPCVAERFMSRRCAPIVIDLALPAVTVGILLSAVNRVARRARAIHGDERVPLPPPPPPPEVLVPAWSLGHVSETQQDLAGTIRLWNNNR